MNITKYLCKKFDKEKKGYVTLNDMYINTFTTENICEYILYTLVFITISLISILIGAVTNHIFNMEIQKEKIFTLMYIGYIVISIIFVSYMIFLDICKYVKNIKVVSCKKKE